MTGRFEIFEELLAIRSCQASRTFPAQFRAKQEPSSMSFWICSELYSTLREPGNLIGHSTFPSNIPVPLDEKIPIIPKPL